ncbi:hypothetical protein BUUB107078_04845 [Burkholderia ubonensis]|nr:hypothetical protein BUB20358_03886 [Burkholderia ubonensis]
MLCIRKVKVLPVGEYAPGRAGGARPSRADERAEPTERTQLVTPPRIVDIPSPK